jgi:hypothetical protein
MSRRCGPVFFVAFSVAAFAATLSLAACGGGDAGPSGVPTPGVSPTPIAGPTPIPSPIVQLPAGMSCSPTPPPLYGLVLKVHNQPGSERRTLDSRPVVINVDGYCEKAGFSSSARFCFTRTEGDFQAPACDYLAVGRSAETARWGPTWSFNGKPCTAGPGENGCANHPDNQFLVNTRGNGEYEACVAEDIPLSTNPDLPGSRCGRCRIAGGGCE